MFVISYRLSYIVRLQGGRSAAISITALESSYNFLVRVDSTNIAIKNELNCSWACSLNRIKNYKEILIINDFVIKTYIVINSTDPIIRIEKPRLIRKYPRIP